MKKKFQICFPKCLKSAAKLRRANQTARAILTAPTVYETKLCVFTKSMKRECGYWLNLDNCLDFEYWNEVKPKPSRVDSAKSVYTKKSQASLLYSLFNFLLQC
jgi:hypothetical protein